ncbi:hypothetical protein [Nitratireductor sp. ZSWI3]|uniref:hypothetical protein n=1 Tax=Nitratireductor sp. ZSWI3 TaxID=2966359 RepID=UPI00214FCDD0|nr:hypothetical protein [Nitratireductor sp. ZSWI3]MCR4265551.1 hypothetical protein [Nitratireductor sp. ZSWI3]
MADTAVDERLIALRDLLASPHFKASDRNRRFLKFVVEETVAGRAGRIKAFTIAVDVFGRDADFDATVDPIVRIAAGQLRKSLHDYYEKHGHGDGMRISLPLGAYVPSFEMQSRAWRSWRGLSDRIGLATGRLPKPLLSAMFGAVLAGALVWSLHLFEPAQGPARPVVVVDNARSYSADPAADVFAQALTDALWIQLAKHTTARFVGVRNEEQFNGVVAEARNAFGTSAGLYELVTTVQVDGSAVSVYWHLIDANSRETYYSSRIDETVVAKSQNDVAEAVAANMAGLLLGHGGVISRYVDGTELLANDLTN